MSSREILLRRPYFAPGPRYYCRKDAQGNIISLLDSTGNCVVKYVYDAWGNHKVLDADGNEITDPDHIGNLNPFRYRGYFFDKETGLYYLKSRYYDPETGRFLNADTVEYLDPESIQGLNLYAYCANNPVMNVDPSGHAWWEWLIGALVIVGLGIATALTGGTAGVLLGAAFYGAITGAVSGALISGVIGGITGGWQGFWDGLSSGFMSGAIFGGITGLLSAGMNIATGAVKIVGSAQKTGTFFHRMASNVQAGKMAMQIGRYSQITLDRSLKKGGLIGNKMPDVIGKARWGKNLAVEVVSKSQTALQMTNKLVTMQTYNPNLAIKVIQWAGTIGRWLF